ncbi:MAG TPA: carbon monoxide dehydrogenase subunit G [Verrucomicrobiae bacterium]|nr:carbon monoxide dehydrogenase subunit G [Verrucomicrobiae bacterium]
MNLEWSGQEQIKASKAKVWAFINDPAKVASCLPDLQSSDVKDAHNVDATVKVAVGPVRGSFKFAIALVPNADGSHMDLKISGGGFGSVVNLAAGADLTETSDGTTLDWKGSASVSGPVATIGGRVLDAQAHRVISTTFENVKNAVSQAA